MLIPLVKKQEGFFIKNKLNIKHILGKAYRGIVNFCLVFNDLFFKNYFNMEIQYII